MKRAIVRLAACGALIWGVAVAAADDSPAPSAQPTPVQPAPAPPAPAQPAPEQTPASNAQPQPPATPATSPTVLLGRVTDVLGKPIPAARVYVLPRGGGRLQTMTDKDGPTRSCSPTRAARTRS